MLQGVAGPDSVQCRRRASAALNTVRETSEKPLRGRIAGGPPAPRPSSPTTPLARARALRIERIEWIGDDAAAQAFEFPPRGLGLWSCANGVREDALVRSLAAALWGPSSDHPVPPGIRRVDVRIRLDDGTTLAIERSLDSGAVLVTGADPDRFDPVGGSREIGEMLLGLGREDFLALAFIDLDGLRATRGNRRLLELLAGARGTRAPAPPAAGPAASPSPPAGGPDEFDLPIVHAELEEFRGAADGRGAAALAPAPEDVRVDRASPDPAGDVEGSSPVDQVRFVRRRIAEIDLDLETLSRQLHEMADRREELRVDGERFGMLTGTEPADVDRLVELTDELAAALNRRAAAVRDRERFEQELHGRGLDRTTLESLRHRFAALAEEDLAFLESAEQGATVRRGNLALTRSECRLDETRLEEIERARTAAARMALVPLVAAAVGLFGSLAAVLAGGGGVLSLALLVLGLAGGGTAAWVTWRGRTLREEERAGIVQALERKRGQMSELEEEGRHADRRAKELAKRAGCESPTQLRHDWRRWKESDGPQHELDALRAREAEAEDGVVGLRGKLSAFRIDDGEGEPDLAGLQALIEDYQRHFHAQRELAAAEEECARVETGLTELEARRAEALTTFEALMASVGIDPDRDPDEAVEMFVLRTRYATGFDGEPAGDSTAGLRAPDPAPAPALALDTSWIPAVSAATEATLRRFLPEARDVEVDGELEPSFRMDPRGPRLDLATLERTLAAAAMDQVWLALRLAIGETLSSLGERFPLFLDDPWTRADDVRYAHGLEWCLDASERGQVVLRTSHEVRVKWFLHQRPARKSAILSILPHSAAPADASGVRSGLSAQR